MEEWDLKTLLINKINHYQGFVNCHAHFDRAFTINKYSLKKADNLLVEKWQMVDELKKRSSQEDYYVRIKRSLDLMISQGVKVCASFIDIDPIVGFKAIKAAIKVKKEYREKISFLIINQTLKGVLDKKAREFIEKAIDWLDIIGGLPSTDRPNSSKHIDYILWLAKTTGKKAHLHVDQENNPHEKETELLAKMVIKQGVEGQVSAVHAISLAAQTPNYRKKVYRLLKQAGISIIVCPSAAINMKDLPYKSYIHKPIAPVVELLEQGISVSLGVDNIRDIYEPFIDGNMWFETRLLMEVCRYYDLETIARIASINGRKNLDVN